MPHIQMEHEVDPKEKLLAAIGNEIKFDILNTNVLVALYVRPEKTKSGLWIDTVEDKHQTKVGLVLKKGPTAFEDESGQWFSGVDIKLHDWVVFRPSDGWPISVNGVPCRMLSDTSIKGVVGHCDYVW